MKNLRRYKYIFTPFKLIPGTFIRMVLKHVWKYICMIKAIENSKSLDGNGNVYLPLQVSIAIYINITV